VFRRGQSRPIPRGEAQRLLNSVLLGLLRHWCRSLSMWDKFGIFSPTFNNGTERGINFRLIFDRVNKIFSL